MIGDERAQRRSGSHRGPGQRAGLSVEAALRAARELVEGEGLERLTMRRLAARLGVAPNTVYSYFPDKAALLDTVMDSLLGEVDISDLDGMDPRAGLAELMRRSRRVLLDHAELLPQFLARPTRGPNALQLGEQTLRLLARMGVDGEEAVDALRILLIYTFGFVAQEVPRREGEQEPRHVQSRQAFASARSQPRMAALAEPLSRHPTESTFEIGLRWLVDGIDRAATS